MLIPAAEFSLSGITILVVNLHLIIKITFTYFLKSGTMLNLLDALIQIGLTSRQTMCLFLSAALFPRVLLKSALLCTLFYFVYIMDIVDVNLHVKTVCYVIFTKNLLLLFWGYHRLGEITSLK